MNSEPTLMDLVNLGYLRSHFGCLCGQIEQKAVQKQKDIANSDQTEKLEKKTGIVGQ